MADNIKDRLFADFPEVPTERWEEVIAADLKGADYDKKLVWRTQEGFNVRPYYRAEDLAGVRFVNSTPGSFPFVRGVDRSNDWRVHQTIRVADAGKANAEALAALDAGCDSIGFCVDGDVDVETLFRGVVLGACEVVINGGKSVAERVLSLVESSGVDAEKVKISFVIDPIVRNLSLKGEFGCCADGTKCYDNIVGLAERAAKYPNVRVVSVSGDKFNESGATITQELAYTMAVGHEYLVRLMERGLSVEKAAGALRFSMSVSSNYFMEIAKFRAARLLWANIVKQYGFSEGRIFAHAVTSRWNQTVYDPYVNMLRGTTEAMSAAIGGVHSLEVTPFDASFEVPTDFSRRIARNVQLLLKHEAHFDQVVDPSGGSYYIENLTNSIAAEAWKLFREVEEKGGYVAAFPDIKSAIEASAAAKDKAVATRRTILLGANQYPNFTETVTAPIAQSCDCAASGAALRPYRGSMAFEEIRLRADRSGKNPTAFMLTCGTLAMARARAQFACNFFACAGIRVMDNTFFANVEDGVRSALESKAQIVVVCAADDDYAALVPQIHKLIGDKAILVVAGAPASQSELEAGGVNYFISVKSNVLATLESYLKELGI